MIAAQLQFGTFILKENQLFDVLSSENMYYNNFCLFE